MTTNAPYLTGHYTPAVDEITATELTVEGSLPPELTGRLIRNSHNPKATAPGSPTATSAAPATDHRPVRRRPP